MTTPRREGAERSASEGSARVYVVGVATNGVVDAFLRQTGIDVRAEIMRPSVPPQPTPVYEAAPVAPVSETAQILAFPAHPTIGEVATGGYHDPAAQQPVEGASPFDGVRRIEEFPDIERPLAA